MTEIDHGAIPERTPCSGCGISRRRFLEGSLAATVVALLYGCGDGQIGAGGNPLATGDPGGSGAGTVVRVADYPALSQVGGLVRIDTTAGPIALVRASDALYEAFSMRCPHQGTTIRISGGAFVCPNHSARFSSAGVWTGGQRTSDLFPVPLTFDAAAGMLTLGITGSTGASGGTGGGDDDDGEEDDD